MGTPDTTAIDKLKTLLGLSYEDFVKKLGEFADDNKILAAIEAGKIDGKVADEKVMFKTVSIPVSELRPTQNEIDLDKSLKFPLKGEFPQGVKDILVGTDVTIKAPIITLNGKYIIDGHHRWSQVYALNKDAVMTALNMETDEDPIDVLKAVQMAIAATIQEVPTQSVQGKNLLDANEDTIIEYVKEHISKVTTDLLMEYKKIENVEQAPEYIWSNVKEMKKTSQPVKGAPDRDFMPQTDDADTDTKSWKDLLKAGVINFKEPVVAESEKHTMRHLTMFESFTNK